MEELYLNPTKHHTIFFSPQARPHVNTYTVEEVLNGTYYQSIFCSVSAKPSASIYWDIRGATPSEDIFSINSTGSILPNGLNSTVSILRFPIHLNNESGVACVIQHPTLMEPHTTVIKLQSFGRFLVQCNFTIIHKFLFAFWAWKQSYLLYMYVFYGWWNFSNILYMYIARIHVYICVPVYLFLSLLLFHSICVKYANVYLCDFVSCLNLPLLQMISFCVACVSCAVYILTSTGPLPLNLLLNT